MVFSPLKQSGYPTATESGPVVRITLTTSDRVSKAARTSAHLIGPLSVRISESANPPDNSLLIACLASPTAY